MPDAYTFSGMLHRLLYDATNNGTISFSRAGSTLVAYNSGLHPTEPTPCPDPVAFLQERAGLEPPTEDLEALLARLQEEQGNYTIHTEGREEESRFIVITSAGLTTSGPTLAEAIQNVLTPEASPTFTLSLMSAGRTVEVVEGNGVVVGTDIIFMDGNPVFERVPGGVGAFARWRRVGTETTGVHVVIKSGRTDTP